MRVIPFDDSRSFLFYLLGFAQDRGGIFKNTLYRGAKDAEFGLEPSALRKDGEERLIKIADLGSGLDIHPDGLKTHYLHTAYELTALSHFYRHANEQGLTLPGINQNIHQSFLRPHVSLGALPQTLIALKPWPPQELWTTLALAQHYGIPTRLLDWSSDPLVAAYFAAKTAFIDVLSGNTNLDQRIAVWWTHSSILDNTAAFSDHDWHSIRRESTIKDHFTSDYTIYVVDAPPYANPNLRAQSGRFTLVINNGKPPEDTDRITLDKALYHVIEQIEDDPEKRMFLFGGNPPPLDDLVVKLTLPVKESPKLLFRLLRLNYGAGRLFPGFDGAVTATNEEAELLNYLGKDYR